MPDKPMATGWFAQKALPVLRRQQRRISRRWRNLRSQIAPRIAVLGTTGLALPGKAMDLQSPQIKTARLRGLDAMVIGPSTVSEEHGTGAAVVIAPTVRNMLIRAETHSVPTVLVVEAAQQLETPLAAVVTHLVTADHQLLGPLRDFAGAERTMLLEQPTNRTAVTRILLELTSAHFRPGA
ncbi:hypothetical protein HGQ17_08605 [Nesterenkonia sp. MY13]|uniref:Uncharacterized protein n=1 Tax=Nesterenkonia sedimenti TaxID=1463632 RepID=A0A7X8YEB9_9MICC|nr:hypothetical protein [Nesterenkonia sedimenti]NLS10057.1 hypothetical protein [Nesterenkonia sedimenti]